MTVTLQEIAEVTGVSPKTVSAILGTRAHLYRPQTRERVQNAARNLGYRPNLAARSTRTGRFHTVSLLHTTDPERVVMSPELLTQLFIELDLEGQQLAFARVPEDYRRGDEVPRALAESNCDGFLVNLSRRAAPEVAQLLDDVTQPSVWLNTPGDHDVVRPDERQGIQLAVDELVKLGHRYLWYVQFSYPDLDRHYSADVRVAGFEAAAERHGLRVRVIDRHRMAPAERFQAVEGWLREADPWPTAVVCYGDEATAFLHAAERLGRRVPKDLSLVVCGASYGGYLEALLGGPRHDYAAIARSAVEMLLKKIEWKVTHGQRAAPMPSVQVPMRYTPAGSVAPPRRTARV